MAAASELSGLLFPVNVARIRESLDTLADDVEFIASGQADDQRDSHAWKHRVNAGRQLVRLRAALNNGDLDRADCALNTLAILRRAWEKIEPFQEKEYHGGPLWLPGEIQPLFPLSRESLHVRKADESYDPYPELRPAIPEATIAGAITELEQKASSETDDARIIDLAKRALTSFNKPRLTTKRKQWGNVPNELRKLSAKLAGLETQPVLVAQAQTVATPEKPKQRGRRKADHKAVEREAQLAADWAQARGAGTHKADFAKEHGLTQKKFDALLDRVAKRKSASE